MVGLLIWVNRNAFECCGNYLQQDQNNPTYTRPRLINTLSAPERHLPAIWLCWERVKPHLLWRGFPCSARSHNARAENLRLGLKGVREGLASPRATPVAVEGVAVFANWTTEPQEWELYETLWHETTPP